MCLRSTRPDACVSALPSYIPCQGCGRVCNIDLTSHQPYLSPALSLSLSLSSSIFQSTNAHVVFNSPFRGSLPKPTRIRSRFTSLLCNILPERSLVSTSQRMPCVLRFASSLGHMRMRDQTSETVEWKGEVRRGGKRVCVRDHAFRAVMPSCQVRVWAFLAIGTHHRFSLC